MVGTKFWNTWFFSFVFRLIWVWFERQNVKFVLFTIYRTLWNTYFRLWLNLKFPKIVAIKIKLEILMLRMVKISCVPHLRVFYYGARFGVVEVVHNVAILIVVRCLEGELRLTKSFLKQILLACTNWMW